MHLKLSNRGPDGVAFAGSIPGVISTGVAMVWALKGGELSTVFTVAGFVLAASARKYQFKSDPVSALI